jgi:hypothetical protein
MPLDGSGCTPRAYLIKLLLQPKTNKTYNKREQRGNPGCLQQKLSRDYRTTEAGLRLALTTGPRFLFLIRVIWDLFSSAAKAIRTVRMNPWPNSAWKGRTRKSWYSKHFIPCDGPRFAFEVLNLVDRKRRKSILEFTK